MSEHGIDRMVAQEIADLHAEFERWFRGESDNITRVDAALADDFRFVSPGGSIVSRNEMLDGLRQGHGSRQIEIRIENPTLCWQRGDVVLATYEEWHEHADYTTTRQSTVVFTVDSSAPGGLLWRHVHETWITPPPRWTAPPPLLR